MRDRRRWFWSYLVLALVALFLLNLPGVGSWGVAHGQTAPGGQAGSRAAEATPVGPGGARGGANLSTPASTMSRASPPFVPVTTLLGLALIASGVAVSLRGLVGQHRKRFL